MSKINQIQNKLRELDGGAFQKLADAYLHKKGYEHLNPIGSVLASNKVRKGTPDTWIARPNGMYIFAEYTTQQGGLLKKLKDDLRKCLNEAKTGISVTKVEEVVFCHTSILTPSEENILRDECQKRGVNLNIFGIGPISYDLYQKYPGLAKEYLNVQIDTGQIVSPDEFVTSYNKNALATPLNTTFYFRDEEIELVLLGMERNDLVVVAGRAGVGKSRLALECCVRFKQAHPEYETRCIFTRGPDLFEDLRVHFSEPGHYLIFVDDANRINRFDYLIQLLQDQDSSRRIKVLATVRDYALKKIRKSAESYRYFTEVVLSHLKDDQIKQLIEGEFNIHNHYYLERISYIAQGNPRLAMMAGAVAKRENTLQSISDVSALYNEYYSSIRRDLEEIANQNLLKAAGIVAFLRVVDRSHDEMGRNILEAFGIPIEVFWEAAERLHDLELFDMYENEVVRTSDQVLSTYLFYLAFFKERVLTFSTLLEHFFPSFKHRLVDALSPVINAFDHKAIIQVVQPHFDRIWKEAEEHGDEETLLHLMEAFWYFKQTDTLLYVRHRVSELKLEVADIPKEPIKANSNITPLSFLNILSLFRYLGENVFKVALEIILDYLMKRPNEISQILYILTDRFGFKHTSHLEGFTKQQLVIDIVWKRVGTDGHELVSMLFISVAEQYLQTHFHTSESKNEATLTIYDFDLPSVHEIFELRRVIWIRLFQIYRKYHFESIVFSLVSKYSTMHHRESVSEIIRNDAVELLPFLDSSLDPTNYGHCLIIQRYLDMLKEHCVLFDPIIQHRFLSDTYNLSEVLFFDWAEKRNLHLEYEEYASLKQQQIKKYFAEYGFSNYQLLFEQAREIQNNLDQERDYVQLQLGLARVLFLLADRDTDLFSQVFEYYLTLGDMFRLASFFPCQKLLQMYGVDHTYDMLSRPIYPSKSEWLFRLYSNLPVEAINLQRLNELYDLYRNGDWYEIPHDMDYLLQYRLIDFEVVSKVTDILLERFAGTSNIPRALSSIFNSYSDVCKQSKTLFLNNIDVIKRAYLVMSVVDDYNDYNAVGLACVLDLDPNFINSYIDWVYDKHEWFDRYKDHHDYYFLWCRNDYHQLMMGVAERIYQRERESFLYLDTYLQNFFVLKENTTNDEQIILRQDEFLGQFIREKCDHINFMQFIFDVIKQFSPERRYPFIGVFLQYNQNFEHFKKLSLEPSTWSWSGSKVPVLQRRVEYFDSLLPLLNSIELLEHRQYIERCIQDLREEIEHEKKKDFMTD